MSNAAKLETLINEIHSGKEINDDQLFRNLERIPMLSIPLFLHPFRRNGQFSIRTISQQNVYNPIHKVMNLFIARYERDIIPQLNELCEWKSMILGELLWYAQYWAIVSGDITFLQQVLSDSRYRITIVQLLCLWETFQYLFRDKKEVPAWIEMKKHQLVESDFPLEIDSDEVIDSYPQYKRTSTEVRQLFLQAIRVWKNTM